MKKNLRKIIVGALILIIIISVIDFTGLFKGGEVQINIESGSTPDKIYALMKSENVILSKNLFSIYAKDSAKDFKAGYHTMYRHMSYKDAKKELLRVVSTSKSERLVTFPEGLELREFGQILEKEGIVTAEAFYDACEKSYDFDFLPKKGKNYLEGYLFPDSYMLSEENTAEEIVKKMLSRFGEIFTKEYRQRAKEMGKSIHEIITMASLIEREAQVDSERPLVASVFYNRINSNEYPYLQSCATVEYILEERKAILSNEDTQIDNPYNTYKYKGLPPGPIASPGQKSIYAALYPAQTNYYFFVANGDGTHTFSENYGQHLNSGVNAR